MNLFEKSEGWRVIEGLYCPLFIEDKYRIVDCPKSEVFFHEFFLKVANPTDEQKEKAFTNFMKKMIQHMQVYTKLRTSPIVTYLGNHVLIRK